MADIYDVLRELNIAFVKHDHPAVFTCEEAKPYYDKMRGGHSKNLFLRNRKGDRHYLVAVEEHKTVDLKSLKNKLGEAKIGFASPERLKEHLGLTPGSVSLLGLVNNADHQVIVVIDEALWRHNVICCHPNINTATLEIKREDLQRFFAWCGNEIRFMKL